MQVDDIHIQHRHWDDGPADGAGRHAGLVTFTCPREDRLRLMQFLCHSARAPDAPEKLIARDLVADALRQARRMPGFRRGEERIDLAPRVRGAAIGVA